MPSSRMPEAQKTITLRQNKMHDCQIVFIMKIKYTSVAMLFRNETVVGAGTNILYIVKAEKSRGHLWC